MAGAADARRVVDGQADEFAVVLRDVAGMHSDANPQRATHWPVGCEKRTLRLDRTRDRIHGAVHHDEAAVTFGVKSVLRNAEGPVQNLAMPSDNVRIYLLAQLGEERGRPFEVGKDQCGRSPLHAVILHESAWSSRVRGVEVPAIAADRVD